MDLQIQPIRFEWRKPFDSEEPMFWWNRSWQMTGKLLNGKRFDLYSYIVVMWRLRVYIGSIEDKPVELDINFEPAVQTGI